MSPKRYPSTRIAAAAASVAIVGTLGAGAVALAQGDASFDPRGFASAYGQGATDAEKGYRANPTDTDAQANRQEDESDEADQAANMDRATQDAFSELPVDTASGTTALNVGEKGAEGSTGTIAAGTGDGTGSEPGGTVVGPVVPGAGDGDGAGEPSGPSDPSNPTTPDVPSDPSGPSGPDAPDNPPAPDEPDEPDNPDVPDEPATPDDPSEGGYDVLPKDPEPEKKGDSYNNTNPVTDENQSAFSSVDPARAEAHITQGSNDDYALYTGQKLDAWTVFCALSTVYAYDGDFFMWTSTKDKFDSYQYFRIDDFPAKVPEDDFDITVSYRFTASDEWHTETITYSPTRSCVFVVSGRTDANGNPIVLAKSLDHTCNLLQYANRVMADMGYMAYNNSSTLDHMMLGYQEAGKPVGYVYEVTPGRHVIEPGDFVEAPEGYSIGMDFEFLDDDFQASFWGSLSYLQRLSWIDYGIAVTTDAGDAAALSAPGGMRFLESGTPLAQGLVESTTLTVPEGVQMVGLDSWTDAQGSYHDENDPLRIGTLKLPSTTMIVNLVSTALNVTGAFEVDPANPYLTVVQDGVLATKDGTRYLGVPSGMEELSIPEGVTQVTFQERNDLSNVVIEASDPANLPSLNLDALSECNVVVPDECLSAFVEANHAALEAGLGTTISAASNPDEKLITENGMLFTSDTLKSVADTGLSSITVSGPHTIASGCFKGNASVTTVVLGDAGEYTFEEGSLEGGSVSTIICRTEEQRASVESQLEAAGGANVAVVCAHMGANGFSYYTQTTEDGTARATLLSAPSDTTSFEGDVLDENGDAIAIDAIASRAFAGSSALQWVSLPASVTTIGMQAFEGCTNLQGVLIGATASVRVEDDAFLNCANLRYIASRAAYGDFAFSGAPNYDCVLYRPTDSEGSSDYLKNFSAFTPQSGVSDFALVDAGGGKLLFGTNSQNEPWLVLGSPNALTGKVELPSTTLEIFIGAFKATGGGFTVNWSDLPNLRYIDGNAFYYSTVAGDVLLGLPGCYSVSIASDAFTGCSNITSFTSESDYFDAASSAFSSCTGLKTVTIAGGAEYRYGFTVNSGIFYGCSSLESIEFTSTTPLALGIYSSGFEFRFDGDWSNTEDSERIKLKVPEESRMAYIKAWAYLFAGYLDESDMYEKVSKKLYEESGVRPRLVEVRCHMAAELLESENYLRQMMGMEKAEKSSVIDVAQDESGYAFETESDGSVKLVGVPTDATEVDLDAAIGDAYSDVTIASNAFSGCTNLKTIIVPDKVTGIETGAFAGRNGVEVRMPAVRAAQLLGGSESAPFTFGAKIKLSIPGTAASDYLAAWPMECLGYTEDTFLGFAWDKYDALVEEQREGKRQNIYAEDLNEIVNAPLLAQENYLRSLMEGYEQLPSIDKLTKFYDAGTLFSLDPRPTESGDAGEGAGDSNANGGDTGSGEGGNQDTGSTGEGDAGSESGSDAGGGEGSADSEPAAEAAAE